MKSKNDYQREYYQNHPELREYRKEYSKTYRRTKKYKDYMKKYRKALNILKKRHEDEFNEIVEGLE
jgi:hypothetical protein